MSDPRIWSSVVIGGVLAALLGALVAVDTPEPVQMHTMDVFDTTLANGFRWIVASVETNRYDSALIARYATMLYHRRVTKALDDTGAVQMEVYVYEPERRRGLRPEDAALLARNNPAIVDRLGKLSVVDSAYVAVRFSTPWMLFGRDTLMVVRTRVYIPAEGYRWASLIRRPRS